MKYLTGFHVTDSQFRKLCLPVCCLKNVNIEKEAC
jgi:hypothetical protein